MMFFRNFSDRNIGQSGLRVLRSSPNVKISLRFIQSKSHYQSFRTTMETQFVDIFWMGHRLHVDHIPLEIFQMPFWDVEILRCELSIASMIETFVKAIWVQRISENM